MKRLLFLTMLLLSGISFLQAQKLVPEKVNPHFGPYEYGDNPEVVMRFKNSDTKPVKIIEYYPRWLDEEQDKNRERNGPQPVITIAPGKIWVLKFRIPTADFGAGKDNEYYIINSNATNINRAGIPFSFEVKKAPPRREREGEEGSERRGGR